MSARNTISEKLDLGFRAGLLSGLHSVVVMRSGAVISEDYFSGNDENWGRPLGRVDFNADSLHDLRSISKSITSLLYGIALERGQVPPLNARLLDSFPQYSELARDSQRSAWTIGHVLNMTLGTEWNEDLPYSDPANSEIAMENAADRYQFILDRPIVQKAGESWNYNGGCAAIIGHLISHGSGQTLQEFAQENLLTPLGIDRLEWNSGRDGVASAASGLRMRAPDLARIGQVVLDGGKWQGRQVIPSDWLISSQESQVSAGMFGYSNFWYQARQPWAAQNKQVMTQSAMGNGGQRLFIIPEMDLVVTTFSGNYNAPDQWMNPSLVLLKIVLASIK